MRTRFALLMAIAAVSVAAGAQTKPVAASDARPELALLYTYQRSNASVDQCGCFSLQGGSATVALPISMPAPSGHWFMVGDVTVGHADSIAKGGYELTLGSYTAGIRYRANAGQSLLKPFGQVLVGAAHATGSLGTGNTPAAADFSAVFASQMGGGLDFVPHHGGHVAMRLVEADYLVTLFHNGVNDHQNILRVSTGIVFRFGLHH